MATDQRLLDACARAAYEQNRVLCIALGDVSQPPWEEASVWQIAAVKEGVFGALAGDGAEESHARWVSTMLGDGWSYGPVKDKALKRHPSLVPFADLPEVEKAKDALFVATVREMAEAITVALNGLEQAKAC